MVDAAIGGKTGMNHRLGKNLIGAIWQPQFVCSDIRYLATLPRRHMTAGLGEIVKYCGLMGDSMVNRVRAFLDMGDLYSEQALEPIVERCAAFKADIVTRDEREDGLRAILNLGHTFGHAVENSLSYGRLHHGEAVALGVLASLEMSALRYSGAEKHLARYRALVESCIRLLPRRRLDVNAILDAIAYDKKKRHGTQRLVLLKRLGRPVIEERFRRSELKRALRRMISVYSG
jgi:3-dehydroquinate synthase